MGTCQKDQKAPLHQGHGLPTLIFLIFINKRQRTKVELNIPVSINNQSCFYSSSLTSEERFQLKMDISRHSQSLIVCGAPRFSHLSLMVEASYRNMISANCGWILFFPNEGKEELCCGTRKTAKPPVSPYLHTSADKY